MPGVVHQGNLDDFWAAPRQPDLKLYSAFRRVLVDRCLIRGGLLSEEGLELLVANAVERLEKDPSEVLALPRQGRRRQRQIAIVRGDAA